MTTLRRNWWLMGLLVLAVALAGCSDDDDPTDPGGDPGGDPPVYEGAENQITPPQALVDSDDPHAQMAVGMIQMVNGLSSYGSSFTPPPSKAVVDGPPWIYTWSFEDPQSNTYLSFTMTVDETAEAYSWVIRLTGSEGTDVYDADLYLASAVAKDDSWGELQVYDPADGTDDPIFEWNWDVGGQGEITFEYISWVGDPERVVIVVNPDGSGSVSCYERDADLWVLTDVLTWDANGDGTWAEYEDGVETGSGSWGSTGGDRPDFGDSYVSPALPAGMTGAMDMNAILTVAQVSMVTSVETHMAWLHDPSAAKTDGPPWVTTWTVTDATMDVTVTLTVDEDGDDYTYELTVDGTMEGETYTDFVFIEAREAMDGADGDLKLYEAGYATPALHWNWWTNVDDSQGCILWGEGRTELDGRHETLIHPDGSGELTVESGDIAGDTWALEWEADWDAAGNGNWASYDAGVPVGSGSWTAATR